MYILGGDDALLCLYHIQVFVQIFLFGNFSWSVSSTEHVSIVSHSQGSWYPSAG